MNKARHRWRMRSDTRPAVYEHVQDTRYTLLQQGYGPPMDGTLTLVLDDEILVKDRVDWGTALIAMHDHRAWYMKRLKRHKRNRNRSR